MKPNPAGLDKVPLAMVQGTIEAVDIMVFIFTLGGLIAWSGRPAPSNPAWWR
ncbi:C4-dicarboxylate ABC transporter [Mobiluncus mulieris]|uniref:C4-dicarboxylate ABC transporter n=1 Tax=Mobiluncus mulieris TaxID=2052 RepID=UPI0021E3118A|nr:C4-dicarboxylate ABC transporter [Mobiluncus mulieris]MCV0012607.1 C4-dicarboxylate ABC transporter [Mobiluncus mulieris]